MKRLIFLIVAIATLAVALSGCQKTKWKMSKQHEKYGCKALEIADAYLDFDLTIEDAYEKINDLCDANDTLPDGTEEEELGNLSIETDVMALQSAFFHAKLRSSGLTGLASNDAVDILTARNELAETLGVKAR